MKFLDKKEWFSFEKPYGELNENIYSNEYYIERYENTNEVIWFGLGVNWRFKKTDNFWTVLSTDETVEPLEKYLPDIVYPEERTIWKKCNTPIYELFYYTYHNVYFEDIKNKAYSILKRYPEYIIDVYTQSTSLFLVFDTILIELTENLIIITDNTEQILINTLDTLFHYIDKVKNPLN